MDEKNDIFDLSETENRAVAENETKIPEVRYNSDKDFYRGMSGELRLKAEGLFKKAKEKGISLEDINITTLKENQVEFPGIGAVELPCFIVRVKGKHLQSGQILADGKMIDYFNRYQRYVADKIEKKNLVKDERGRPVREDGKLKIKQDIELTLGEWERFEIGKNLIDDKEFGLEKTITGACDRVIRKLMGENDWLYPEEARLLDEEFNMVQNKITKEQAERKQNQQTPQKKATERQISFLKAKIKNSGLDAENIIVMNEIIKQAGLEATDVTELSTAAMSRLIDSANSIVPKVKEIMAKQDYSTAFDRDKFTEAGEDVKQ